MSRMPPTEPRRYLIAIGSSRCPKMGLPVLEYVEGDIRKVTDLFEAQGYERVLADQIDLDDMSHSIKTAVSNWFASSNRSVSDCVIIYYGGHGDEGGRFGHHYLFTFESKDNNLGTTAIRTKDFVESFFQGDSNTSPQNILLILDTCYANVGGRQISQVLGELKGVAPAGSGFWVISSSDTYTEAGDGAFVEALCAVMDSNQDHWRQDREFIEISTLVERINKHFETTHQAQRAIATGTEIQTSTKFIRNPRFIAQEARGQGEWGSELVNCLWSLDCREQIRKFEDHTPPSCRIAAFVVQAQDTRIRSWLIKRLFNKLPNVSNAQVFSFVIPAHPIWKSRNFNELWIDLGKQLKCEQESEVVLDNLVSIYQTKPVIIVMYGWQASPRSQRLQQQVITEFWQPLVQQIKDLPYQPRRSRFILFLAEESAQDPGVLDQVNHIIRLPPLTQISCDDVADWLDSQQVSPLLEQVRSEEDIDCLIKQEIEYWNRDPAQTIQQICYVFELNNGIADLEAEWRLVG